MTRPAPSPQAPPPSTQWEPIDTAPRDGSHFLICQDGEIYLARRDPRDGRLMWRTHGRRVQSRHRIIDAELDGLPVKAEVPIDQPWVETFVHNWTFWTLGFDFKPTHWHPAPALRAAHSIRPEGAGE